MARLYGFLLFVRWRSEPKVRAWRFYFVNIAHTPCHKCASQISKNLAKFRKPLLIAVTPGQPKLSRRLKNRPTHSPPINSNCAVTLGRSFLLLVVAGLDFITILAAEAKTPGSASFRNIIGLSTVLVEVYSAGESYGREQTKTENNSRKNGFCRVSVIQCCMFLGLCISLEFTLEFSVAIKSQTSDEYIYGHPSCRKYS